MILLDPIFKLELLKEYMSWRIDGAKERPIGFEKWIKNYKRRYHYPSPDSLCMLATHCYFCGKPYNDARKPTIDHFDPISKRETGEDTGRIRVICCKQCNLAKSDLHPADYVRRLNIASMTGGVFKNYSKKDTDMVSRQVSKIMDDIINGAHKVCYYTRKGNYLPKNFIEI